MPSAVPVSGVRDSDHVNRRTLPLLLAVLLATAGCVSVAPADNKPPRTRPTVSVPAPASGRVAEEALPLTPLPVSRPPAPVVVAEPENGTPASAPRQAPRTAKTDRSSGPKERTRTVRQRPERLPVKAKRSTPQRQATKPKAKPHRSGPSKPVAPQRSRATAAPVPGHVSMAELCRSSHGVTSPTISQLCHGTYR